MGAKSKKPKIRFAGFAEDWEQRRLGDVVIFLPHNTFSRADLSENGEILNIHYGDVLVKFGEVLDVSDEQIPFVSKTKKINNIDKLKLKNGDIIFADAAEDETVGKCTEVYAIFDKSVISGLHTIPCRPKINFAAAYLGYFFNSQCYHTQLLPLMQGIKVLSLSKTALLQTDIFYPSKQSEQAKIGTFFRHLDHLITLHQRKCGRLKNIKKAMLERMFPKKGADVPEVRFAGFTGAWEQRKLGELMLFQNGFNSGSDAYGSGIALISVMDILNNNCITYSIILGKAQVKPADAMRYSVEYGDVLFQRSSENVEDAGRSNVYLDSSHSAIFGGFVIRGKKKSDYNPIFIKYLLDTFAIRIQITSKAQGAQHINVTQETLQDVQLYMPSLTEQKQVGTFFRHLDHLITLHQRKLTLLQNIKKACLANMFA